MKCSFGKNSMAVHQFKRSLSLKNLKQDRFCPEVLQLLERIRPTWFRDDRRKMTENLNAKVLSGGFCNHMVVYYDDRCHDDMVVVRVAGEDTDKCFDKQMETQNMKALHAARRGPPLYATFNNGMAYKYINGITLNETTVKLEHLQKLIAKELIEFHKVEVDGRERRPAIWDLFHTLLDMSPTEYMDPVKNKQFQKYFKPKQQLSEELHHLNHHLDKLNSPVVFCHNDLRPSNILYDQDSDRVTFVDVECATYSNEHFDIGNHFMKYAGVETIDFDNFPDKDYQLSWLRYYLEQKAILNGGSRSEITDKDVESCYVKVNKFSLLSMLGWAMFGLAMADRSKIEFDFLRYSKKQFDLYYCRKESVLSMTVP